MYPRRPWLWLLIIVNVIAALIMYETGEMVGDLVGASLYSYEALFWATSLVVLSYLLLLGPFFNFITGIKIKKLNLRVDEVVMGERLGAILVFFQIAYLVYTLSYGLNIAGSAPNKASTPLSIFFVLVPPEALFLVYYGMYRESRYFSVNLLVWITSSVLRGWSGIFLVIIFLEWCRMSRTNKINKYYVSVAVVVVVVSYPLISNFKWLIRSFGSDGYDFLGVVLGVADNLASSDYFDLITIGLTHLITRLQTVSLLVETMRLSDLLQAKFELGAFAPFWKEGLHGVVYDRALGIDQLLIGTAFTQYMETPYYTIELGAGNVSLGYPGWFFIAPLLTPFYLAYTFMLAYLSHYVFSKLGESQFAKDVLWYSWFGYLLAPWFSVFINFIYASFVFLVLKIFVSRVTSRRVSR